MKLFFVSFSSFFLSVSQGTFRVLRGANVISVFHSHKLFLIFFENFFSALISFSCQSFRERLSLLRVQKYHLYLHLQDFFLYFFHVFKRFFLNRLITDSLRMKVFLVNVRFFLFQLLFPQFKPAFFFQFCRVFSFQDPF